MYIKIYCFFPQLRFAYQLASREARVAREREKDGERGGGERGEGQRESVRVK